MTNDEMAEAVGKALNPMGERYRFIMLVFERPPPGTSKTVPATIVSNLPLETTSPNNVAKLLADAAKQVKTRAGHSAGSA